MVDGEVVIEQNPREKTVVKVCHVAMGDLWAGAEVHLLALMTYLVRHHDFEWSVILFNEGRLAEELRKLPLSLIVIPEKSYSPPSIIARLAKIFQQARPAIVHTHKYKDSILSSIAARYRGVPHVIRTVHGMSEPFTGLSNLKMKGYKIADRLVTGRLVDKVIAVSSEIQKFLVPTYGPNKVVCIHNGIDLEAVQLTRSRAEKRKEWQVDEKTVLIGTVGRLVPVKGHAILLEAFRILRQRYHNIRLIFVGDGPLRGHLYAEAKRLGLEQSVIFSGHQERSYDYINMMDLFVLPSRHEGIPMVLLEAYALKRPVIASRVGGIPEVVTHARSGFLVSPEDSEAFAQAMSDLIEDQGRALAFGQEGRKHVECEFSAGMMADRTAGIYRSLGAGAR